MGVLIRGAPTIDVLDEGVLLSTVRVINLVGAGVTGSYDAANDRVDVTIPGYAGMSTDPIWDAAGDLAVGTGPDAAAALAKGPLGSLLQPGATSLFWTTSPSITGLLTLNAGLKLAGGAVIQGPNGTNRITLSNTTPELRFDGDVSIFPTNPLSGLSMTANAPRFIWVHTGTNPRTVEMGADQSDFFFYNRTDTYYLLRHNLAGLFTAFPQRVTVGADAAPTAAIFEVGGTFAVLTALGRVAHVTGTLQEYSSGAHTRLVGLEVTAPVITPGGATVADTASVYISGAPVATVTGANYALWVDDGPTRLDGPLDHDGATVGFFGSVPVLQPTQLTTRLSNITHGGPATPTYIMGSATNVSPWGLSTQDKFETMLSVIRNLQFRVNDLEDKLASLGLLAPP